MDLEYSVTETVHRNRAGEVVQIDYVFDETVVIETPNTFSSTGMARSSKEKRNRSYDVSIKRDQYQKIARQLANSLSFDAFLDVLRPFILGYYESNELERAFYSLDRDRSGTIHIDELASFLPVLNDAINTDALNGYIRQIDENFDGTINYDEFRSLVLRGIGRDIICNHF